VEGRVDERQGRASQGVHSDIARDQLESSRPQGAGVPGEQRREYPPCPPSRGMVPSRPAARTKRRPGAPCPDRKVPARRTKTLLRPPGCAATRSASVRSPARSGSRSRTRKGAWAPSPSTGRAPCVMVPAGGGGGAAGKRYEIDDDSAWIASRFEPARRRPAFLGARGRAARSGALRRSTPAHQLPPIVSSSLSALTARSVRPRVFVHRWPPHQIEGTRTARLARAGCADGIATKQLATHRRANYRVQYRRSRGDRVGGASLDTRWSMIADA